MPVAEYVIVFFIALIIASVFFYGFKSRGPWGAFWIFLLILVLAAWAGRLWIIPAGPVLWGSSWLPVIFFVLIIALAIAAATPSSSGKMEKEYEPGTDPLLRQSDRQAAAAFSIFFWILMLVLIVAIIAGLFT